MEKLQAEITAIQGQIATLQEERAKIKFETPVTIEAESPEAIAQAYREQARKSAEIAAELKGIDDAIAALSKQLKHKQIQWDQFSQRQPIDQQVEAATAQAQQHAERINELAVELTAELQALKAIAHDLSPAYWQLYHRPFITGFKTYVPYVHFDREVWSIVSRPI